MSYRVFWTPDAEQRLEAILVRSADAPVVAAAAREIDRNLVENALTLGESRYENVRVGFARPLGVQFEVLDEAQTVIVFHVWRTDRRLR